VSFSLYIYIASLVLIYVSYAFYRFKVPYIIIVFLKIRILHVCIMMMCDLHKLELEVIYTEVFMQIFPFYLY